MDVRRLVATGSRILGRELGDDYVWGHVSVRDPQDRGVWIKRSGLGLSEITPDDVHLVDRDGNVRAGEGPRHLEYAIHTELMASRPDVNAVVHAHPFGSIVFAATGQSLLPISHAGTMFTDPGLARFEATGDLIVTRELGEALAACLGMADAALMVNHGVVTVGATLGDAVVRALILEEACRHQLSAVAVAGGAALRQSSAEEAITKQHRIWNEQGRRQAWHYLLRRHETTERTSGTDSGA